MCSGGHVYTYACYVCVGCSSAAREQCRRHVACVFLLLAGAITWHGSNNYLGVSGWGLCDLWGCHKRRQVSRGPRMLAIWQLRTVFCRQGQPVCAAAEKRLWSLRLQLAVQLGVASKGADQEMYGRQG